MDTNQQSVVTTEQPVVTPTPAMERQKEPQGIFRHVSGRTITLIMILAAFTGFFLYLALKPSSTSTPVITRIQPTPTPDVAHSTLTLNGVTSSTSATTQNSQKSFTIDIDTSTNKVTAVQVTLAFNPKNVANISVTPGTFFLQATELIKNIDYTGGRIAYAIAIPPTGNAVMGKGTVATVNYSIVPTATGDITFTFMPKTLVTAEGINPSVLKTFVGLDIPVSLQPSIATPSSR